MCSLLWPGLSGFDEAMVPKESTIFFPARFKGQGRRERGHGLVASFVGLH